MEAQSAAATLPVETIALILELAQSDTSCDLHGALERRQTLHAAGLVCRAWAAEVSRLNSFIVTSKREASNLLVLGKLGQAEPERRQGTGGRTTRARTAAARVVLRPREFIFVQGGDNDDYETVVKYIDLVKASSPGLESLRVWKEFAYDPRGMVWFLAMLEEASRGGAGTLRTLSLFGFIDDVLGFLTCLAQLPTLEILDLSECSLALYSRRLILVVPRPFLPSLTDLRIAMNDKNAVPKVFDEIVKPSTSLRSLAISHGPKSLPAFLPLIFEALSSVAPRLVHLSCAPDARLLPFEANGEDEADLLQLLGRMKELKTLAITLVDPATAFFTTIRALPRLQTVHLFIASPVPTAEIAGVLADASFRRLEISTSGNNAWKMGDLEMVRAAADAAAVGFRWMEC